MTGKQNGFVSVVPVGRLGATVPEGASTEQELFAGLSEAENRILKLEKRVLDLESRQDLYWGPSR